MLGGGALLVSKPDFSKLVTRANGSTRCSPSSVGRYLRIASRKLRGHISREFVVEKRDRPPQIEICNESRI
jgi:hypothetical protein